MNEVAFLLGCPNCGQRSVYEFRFRREVTARPETRAMHAEAIGDVP